MVWKLVTWKDLTNKQGWLGVLNEREYYNGCTANRARRPQHVLSLLEQNNIIPDTYPGEGAARFIGHIDSDLRAMRYHREG